MAIGDSGILAGGDLLFLSPTGSGKGLVGDAAAAAALARGRQVLYLTSTRSLARETAGRLARALGPAGFRVVATSRDDREADEDILAGRTDLAVAVYEKARSLFARSAPFRGAVGCIVADEISIVEEAERGLGAFALLRAWRACGPQRPQLVALASRLQCPSATAAALEIPPLVNGERAAPLRVGELHPATGRLAWQPSHDGEALEIAQVDGAPEEPELLLGLLDRLPRPVLVFCPTRRNAVETAQFLADRLPLDPQPRQAPSSPMGGPLGELLQRGVGLHTSDLTREQRLHVEELLRAGVLQVCAATTTLAEGVNLSVRSVILLPGVEELAGGRIDNLLGRAGRPGMGGGVAVRWCTARATAPAPTPSAANRQETVTAAVAWLFASATPPIAQARCHDLLAPALEEGEWSLAMEAGLRDGLWEPADEPGTWRLLPAGRIVATGGVPPAVVAGWRTILRRFPQPAGDAAVAFLALGAGDACGRLPLAPHERQAEPWRPLLRERLADDPSALARYFVGFLDDMGPLPRRLILAAKGALLYLDALDSVPVHTLAEQYAVPPGIVEEFLHGAHHVVSLLYEFARLQSAPWPAHAASLPPDNPPARREAESPAAEPAEPARSALIIEPDYRVLDQPRLVIHRGSTGMVRFDGVPVHLTRIQFRLLEILALNPDEGVPYERIDAYVWPDAKVERQQVSFHRRRLEEKLLAGRFHRQPLIETHASWGLRLCLPRDDIQIEKEPALRFCDVGARVLPVNFVARPVSL